MRSPILLALSGHTTIIRGEDVRTGVTVILPHPGNLFREKLPGAVFVGNAFGKLAGSTQVNELGEKGAPVEEGSVGAGIGTVAFGFKGGIGTSSRCLPPKLGEYRVGVLVQTNFGGRAHDSRRCCRPGTGTLLPARRASTGRHRDRPGKRISDGRHRHRRACGRTEPRAHGGAGDVGAGAHGRSGIERKRGLCDRVLDRIPDADTVG